MTQVRDFTISRRHRLDVILGVIFLALMDRTLYDCQADDDGDFG